MLFGKRIAHLAETYKLTLCCTTGVAEERHDSTTRFLVLDRKTGCSRPSLWYLTLLFYIEEFEPARGKIVKKGFILTINVDIQKFHNPNYTTGIITVIVVPIPSWLLTFIRPL